MKLLYNSWENLFSERNADYFDHISWTGNLFQRPQCVQGNMESKAWRRTYAYRTKQLCWQICGWTYDISGDGEVCKGYLIFFEVAIARTVF